MMTETDSRITQVLSLVDELFAGNQTKNYRVAIQVGNAGLSAAVWDDVYNKIIALEQFRFQKAFNPNVLLALANNCIKQSHILSYPYKKVTLAFVNAKSTLVPNALFDVNEKEALLKFNHTLDDTDTIVIDSLPNLDAKNIFALPKTVAQQFGDLYPNINIVHYSSPLIEQVLLAHKHSDSTNVIVNVHADSFEVLAINAGKLIFYNTFKFQTPEDFIYYILFVLEQLKLNPETVNVELLGEIEKSVDTYKHIFKYVRNVKFGGRPDSFDYSFKIAALPKHNHFSLFSQFLLS